MIENQFSCGLIPAEIAEEALKLFNKHDIGTSLKSLAELEAKDRIKRAAENIFWKQMMDEFPHAVVNMKPYDD